MQILTSAFGPKGQNVVELRQRFAITPPAVEAGELEYDVASRLPLKPGRYEVRVGVQQENAAGGSVYTTFDVPNFARLPLSLSGFFWRRSRARPPARPSRGRPASADHDRHDGRGHFQTRSVICREVGRAVSCAA